MRVIKLREFRWTENVARMVEMRSILIMIGRPEENGPLRRPRCRREDNIRMDLGEIVWRVSGGLDSSDSAQGPVAVFCEHGNELSNSLKGGVFLGYGSDYEPLKKDSKRS
jgi:hypothetical protein